MTVAVTAVQVSASSRKQRQEPTLNFPGAMSAICYKQTWSDCSRPRATLAQLPTPIHRLDNFGGQLDGQELWIKRDDLTGLEGGGNKTRKLEFLVGDAIETGADMLVTAGAIQSNHTRQTAAAAPGVSVTVRSAPFGRRSPQKKQFPCCARGAAICRIHHNCDGKIVIIYK